MIMAFNVLLSDRILLLSLLQDLHCVYNCISMPAIFICRQVIGLIDYLQWYLVDISSLLSMVNQLFSIETKSKLAMERPNAPWVSQLCVKFVVQTFSLLVFMCTIIYKCIFAYAKCT